MVVVVNDPASLTATWTSPVCAGNALFLQGSGNNASGFSWSGPASFSSTSQNPSRNNMQTSFQGIYTLNATIPGCGTVSTTTSSVTITCREGRTLHESEAEIFKQEENAEFRLWPNPITETNFNLQMPGNQQPDRIYLINMLGQKMEILEGYIRRTQEDLWKVEIPAYIGSGKYILMVETENRIFREPLLILRD